LEARKWRRRHVNRTSRYRYSDHFGETVFQDRGTGKSELRRSRKKAGSGDFRNVLHV
jgi:hypothetical protein